MRGAALHRAACRCQRLAEHLPAEDLRRADIATLATEYVLLDGLEFEQRDQIGKTCVH